VIDVQGKILRFFALDHVLVSLVNLLARPLLLQARYYSQQFTKKNRLAAGLRPYPLEELQRSPILPSRNKGPIYLSVYLSKK